MSESFAVSVAEGMDFEHELGVSAEAFCARVLSALWQQEGRELRLSLHFTNDEEIAAVHGDWLDDPTPTDVISFPIDGDEFGEHAFDGELVIGFEHAQRVARELQQDFATELALYVVHGALHLLGYDDHAEDDLVRMKLAESQVMRALGMNVRERYE